MALFFRRPSERVALPKGVGATRLGGAPSAALVGRREKRASVTAQCVRVGFPVRPFWRGRRLPALVEKAGLWFSD